MNRFRFCLSLLLVLVHAHAEKVGWHPAIVGELGRGLDSRNQDLLKPKVTIINETDLPPAANTGEARINVSFSQHQFDLVKSFALNTSVSVKAGLYSGKVGFGFVDNTSHSANRLNFAFECSREFGERIYPQENLKLAPEFIATVNQFKQTLRGPALERAITERYGTHFISGHQSAAKVVILYTFSFESQTLSLSLSASLSGRYRGGFSQAGFQADVKSLLEQKDSRVTLSYQFYSTDPEVLPDFPLTAEITTFPGFLEFAAKVETYCKTMNPARAKRMAYIVEPLKNLPGYPALLDGFMPADQFSTSYDRFLEAYAQLKAWDDLLFAWTVDVRRMNWMNTKGQALALALRRDTANHLKGLEEKAKRHFEQGEPLEVSDDLLNFFVNFNRLPLPAIYHLGRVDFGEALPFGVHKFGWLYCGSKELTAESPFYGISHKLEGIETPDLEQITYSAADFERITRERWQGFPSDSFLNGLFSSPQWIAITNQASTNRIGFFETSTRPSLSSRVDLVIRDLAGDSVDTISFNSSRSGGTVVTSLEAASETRLGVVAIPRLEQAVLGRKIEQVLVITNSGSGSAYGTVLQAKLETSRHEFLSIGGSQGVGGFGNGLVTYEVGPLAAGASATVKLSLIPLVSDVAPADELVRLSFGEGLSDPEPADNQIQLGSLVVAPPHLTAARTGFQVELRWHSDTARLGLESAAIIGSGADWQPVLATPENATGERTVRENADQQQRRFYRLNLRN